MGKTWAFCILIFCLYGIFTGRGQDLSSAILELPQETFDLCLVIVTTSCFYCGIMRILQECNVIAWLAKKLRFLFRIITPNLKDQEALECISTNIAANMLGLGFAATPSGLKGMKRLQELNENKEEASDEMITFLVLNTAGVTLFPTTMIAIRQALGSTNPLDFLAISMISSIGSTILGLIMERLMRKKRICSTT